MIFNSVSYITGRGGELDRGLAVWLASRFERFSGLAVNDKFLAASVESQVESIREFSMQAPSTPLITNSYGGYLLLLSLIKQSSAPKRVLMLSPLLGRSLDKPSGLSVRPPRERLLREAVEAGDLCKPDYLEVVTGENDPLCDVSQAREFAAALPIDKLTALPDEAHNISPEKVAAVVSAFVGSIGNAEWPLT